MGTIALYAGKMNQMSSLIGGVRKSVDDYSSELFSLKSKTLNIRKSVCDLDDVSGMIQASTEIQEKKIESLENFKDFYNKYNYLKPDAEKNFLEICFDSAAEWCKEHWKEILIGLSFIVIGALLSWITGGSFLPMLLSGLKAALTSGAITGGINAGISIVSSLVQGEDIGTIIGNSLNAFGDGFAGGFMIGGIMAGTSMALSSGFRIAAKSGVRTGKKGGIGKEGVFKILSPDRIAADGNSGGTLFKIGKTFRVDVDTRIIGNVSSRNHLKLPNFFHMHLPGVKGNVPWLGINCGHIPIGLYFSVIFGSGLSFGEVSRVD